MRSLLLLLFPLFALLAQAKLSVAQSYPEGILGGVMLEQNDDGAWKINRRLSQSENPRLVAIALDLSLGLFGMHRLYLGTDVRVPAAYTLTFGGGGVLWLVDLALLIGSKDIEKFKNNPHFFMWIPSNK